eukprot:280051-Chlamydomonas_euryale.AAC.6
MDDKQRIQAPCAASQTARVLARSRCARARADRMPSRRPSLNPPAVHVAQARPTNHATDRTTPGPGLWSTLVIQPSGMNCPKLA